MDSNLADLNSLIGKRVLLHRADDESKTLEDCVVIEVSPTGLRIKLEYLGWRRFAYHGIAAWYDTDSIIIDEVLK